MKNLSKKLLFGLLAAGILLVAGCKKETANNVLFPTSNETEKQDSENNKTEQEKDTESAENKEETDSSPVLTPNAGSDITLVPADFTIRIARSEESRAGEVLATGEDLAFISRENIIFYFTDTFKKQTEERNTALSEEGKLSYNTGYILGVDESINNIELWIKDECIYSGSLREYINYETTGFMTDTWQQDSAYYWALTMMDDGGVYEMDRTIYEKAAEKIHSFAAATGLEKEYNPLLLTETGIYQTEQDYIVDLDKDGKQETLFYGQATLLINGINYADKMAWRDNPDINYFYLWDINSKDSYLEIGIWSRGPSDDDYLDLYHYNGKELEYVGTLPGMPEKMVQKESGVISAEVRLMLLQTWFADMDFRLNEEHKLEQVEEELYYTRRWIDEVEEYPYTSISPLRLYETMDKNGAYNVLEEGVELALPATDNKCFVQVQTKDGRTGYLHVEGFYRIEKPDGGYYDYEAISGLIQAD